MNVSHEGARELDREVHREDLVWIAATLAELVATRTGLDRHQVAAALNDTPILDETSLVALGRQLDTIRQQVLDGRQEVIDGRSS